MGLFVGVFLSEVKMGDDLTSNLELNKSLWLKDSMSA